MQQEGARALRSEQGWRWGDGVGAIRIFLSRWAAMFGRRRLDRELNEELRTHLGMAEEEYRRRGMNEEEARQKALRDFGGVTQVRETVREMEGVPLVDSLMQDVRFGCRQALRSPAFTVTVLATLALGIGATTAIFSLVDAVLLRPLPYKDSQKLVGIYEDGSGSGLGLEYDADTPGGYADFTRQKQIFSDVAAIDGGDRFSLVSEAGEARAVAQQAVTWNLFPMLHVHALYGRVFTQAEDQPGHEHVVVLSFRLWQEQFGGNPKIIGQDVRLDNRFSVARYTVIGVMPPHFSFPSKDADIWIPRAFSQAELESHGEHYLRVVARLRDGVTLSRANADLQTLADQTRQLYPYEKSLRRFFAEPLQASYTRDARGGLFLMMTAVGLILLIACANVASLLLSRASVRQREVGLRTALGASRARIVRQLLTESVLLGVCGGVLGAGLAKAGFVFLKNLIPADLQPSVSLSLNLEVLTFVLVVILTSSMLFGLMPSWRLSRSDLNSVLKEGAKGSAGLQQGRLGALLAAGEIGLCVVLLAGSGLLLKSFLRLRNVDAGFRADHVLAMGNFLRRAPEDPNEYAARMRMFEAILDKVRTLPGVRSAGFTSELPLGWAGARAGFLPEGAPVVSQGYGAYDRVITPGYFETLRIPLTRGRDFDEDDRANAPAVVIVNQVLARTYWPNQDPIGKRLKFGGMYSPYPWATVVGVVGNERQVDLANPPGPEMYFPFWQARGNYMTPHDLVLRADGDPGSLAGPLRAAVKSVDPNQPLDDVYPLEEIIDLDVAPRWMQTVLVGSLAALALAIACVGIYGVVAYLVSQRTREVGIRMALGAQRRDVLLLIVRGGAKMALAGIGSGLLVALAVTRLMRSQLFGVSAADPEVLGAVCVLLLAVALAACVVPARRAADTDPVRALHNE